MSTNKKEVAKVEAGGLPAEFLSEIENDFASGDFNDFKAEDIITPRLKILQDLSKEIKKARPEYIAGAEAGQIINTATKELYDGGEGVILIPVVKEDEYVEWVPQSAGGGLVHKWGDDESFKKIIEKDGSKRDVIGEEVSDKGFFEKEGRWISKEKGTEIIRIANYYVLLFDEKKKTYTPCIISFSGTKYKVNRKWATLISTPDFKNKDGKWKPYPYFYKAYVVRTIIESNENNQWFNYKIDKNINEEKGYKTGFISDLPDSKSAIEMARNFRSLVKQRLVKANEDHIEDIKSDETI